MGLNNTPTLIEFFGSVACATFPKPYSNAPLHPCTLQTPYYHKHSHLHHFRNTYSHNTFHVLQLYTMPCTLTPSCTLSENPTPTHLSTHTLLPQHFTPLTVYPTLATLYTYKKFFHLLLQAFQLLHTPQTQWIRLLYISLQRT